MSTHYYTPHIAVINESTALSDSEIDAALPAMRYAVAYHFRPFWGVGASLIRYDKTAVLPKDRLIWPAYILDDSDQAGALGYHETNMAGTTPDLKVFAKTDQRYGLSWQVTFMHEVFETLADPYIAAMTQTATNEAYATEVGDPVEADEDGYDVTVTPGVTVRISNFVLPAWFEPGAPPPYDHGKLLTKPLEVRPGGYVSICRPSGGSFSWTQYQQQHGQLVAVGSDDDEWEDKRDVFTAPSGAVMRDHPRFRDRGGHHDGSTAA